LQVYPLTTHTFSILISKLLIFMPPKITEDDFKNAARALRCDVAAIKAVAEVESSGNGFLSDGRVKILFEGHHFCRYTHGKYVSTHPFICYPKWTRVYYTRGKTSDIRGAGELERLYHAMALNRTAALLSASYGKFQIMGFNFAICGFVTVEDFYNAMQTSEGEHLNAFCNYIKGNALADELREHRWSDLARRYNGPEYKKNQYDYKLDMAYKKYSQK
jgi:hypothetical protein